MELPFSKYHSIKFVIRHWNETKRARTHTHGHTHTDTHTNKSFVVFSYKKIDSVILGLLQLILCFSYTFSLNTPNCYYVHHIIYELQLKKFYIQSFELLYN